MGKKFPILALLRCFYGSVATKIDKPAQCFFEQSNLDVTSNECSIEPKIFLLDFHQSIAAASLLLHQNLDYLPNELELVEAGKVAEGSCFPTAEMPIYF